MKLMTGYEETPDIDGVEEHCDMIERNLAERMRATVEPTPTPGQDESRGILAVNPHVEGSMEWYAWNAGFAYAERTGGMYSEPLSGEWADMVEIRGVLQGVADSYYEYYDPDSPSSGDVYDVLDDWEVDTILDEFELGYATYVAGWR